MFNAHPRDGRASRGRYIEIPLSLVNHFKCQSSQKIQMGKTCCFSTKKVLYKLSHQVSRGHCQLDAKSMHAVLISMAEKKPRAYFFLQIQIHRDTCTHSCILVSIQSSQSLVAIYAGAVISNGMKDLRT